MGNEMTEWTDFKGGLTPTDHQILDLVAQLYHRNTFTWMKKDRETIPKLIQLLGELHIDAPDLLKAAIRGTMPNLEGVCGKLWEDV
jgi:hypothetical protein